MSKRGFFLKPVKSNATPSECIWLDTETRAVPITDAKERHVLAMGYAAYSRKYDATNWTKTEWLKFDTVKAIWDFIESKCRKKRKIYIFAHNWNFDLPVIDGFREPILRGWVLKRSVIEGPPVILEYRKDQCTITFLDTLNFWRTPLKKLGETVGLPKLEMPDQSASEEEWETYCKRDVEIIVKAILDWIAFLESNEMGGFANTLAAQSMRVFKHRFLKHKILLDDNKWALDLARQSLHGGRTECHFIGTPTEDIYKLDINSQYPGIMKNYDMPTILLDVIPNPTLDELIYLSSEYCVCADVSVNTEIPAYGLVHDNRLIFPVGQFRTVLTTPELKFAIKHGHITSCYAVAVYEKARIFKEFVEVMYKMRRDFEDSGNGVYGHSCKILMNSLAGKFAQRGLRFDIVGATDDITPMCWSEYDVETGVLSNFRQYAGVIEEYIREGEARESHPAINSHVTAYGRMQLFSDALKVGMGNIYYFDTDCMWTNKEGARIMAPLTDPTTLGRYKVEGISNDTEIRAPKDYRFGTSERIKGVSDKAEKKSDNEFIQLQFSTLKGLVREGRVDAPIIRTITKHLKREYTKGIVTSSGRVVPFRFGTNRRSGNYIITGRG